MEELDKDHMHYMEPNKELLAEYKLASVCLRCGVGSQDTVRRVETNFCMSCWMAWYASVWEETERLNADENNNIHYNAYRELYV